MKCANELIVVEESEVRHMLVKLGINSDDNQHFLNLSAHSFIVKKNQYRAFNYNTVL